MKKERENTTEFEATVEQAEVEEQQNQADDATTAETNASNVAPNLPKGRSLWWLKYLITAVVLAVLTVLIAWREGAFVETNQKELLSKLSDAFFAPGILTVFFGLLVVCSNGGAFDMLSYGFQTLFRMFKKDPLDRKYGSYYEYSKAKRKKKRSFWFLLIVGGVFTLVGGALLLGFALA